MLTEHEIFLRLSESLRTAADCAEKLAVAPHEGSVYRQLREHLALIEGASRQAAMWRGDSRWLPIGFAAHKCHEMAGGWLRGSKTPQGKRIPMAVGQKHVAFSALAEMLKRFYAIAEKYRTDKVGITGLILPETPGVATYLPPIERIDAWKQ